jgi:kynureninase
MTPQDNLNLHLAESKATNFLDATFAAYMDDKDPLKALRDEFVIPTRGEIAPGKPTSHFTLPPPPPFFFFFVKVTKLFNVLLQLLVTIKKILGADRPDEPCTYFCGNSLGLLPKAVARYVAEELQVWGEGAVNSHFKHRYGRPWVRIEETVQEQSARVVGALKDEVAIMNSLTTNLHTLLAAFYTPTQDRHKILIESKAFPSDHYAVESQIRWHQRDPKDSLICQEPRQGETLLRTEDILETIEKHGHEISVVCFSGVQFYTGQYFEMEKITKAAQAKVTIILVFENEFFFIQVFSVRLVERLHHQHQHERQQ